MPELGALFDSFYSRFVLRDLFGKIAPGMMLLCAITIGTKSLSDAVDLAAKASLGAWVLLGGLAWLLGLSLQGLGELVRVVRYFPKGVTWDRWNRKIVRFREIARPAHVQDFERFTVVKEACGNAAVAALVSALVMLVARWGTPEGYITAVSTALVIPGLLKMHVANAKRANDYVDSIVNSTNGLGGGDVATEQQHAADGAARRR